MTCECEYISSSRNDREILMDFCKKKRRLVHGDFLLLTSLLHLNFVKTNLSFHCLVYKL